MTTDLQRASATIYAFPARGRFAPGSREGERREAGALRIVPTVSGSGSWYHEEAIREADRNRKN